MQRSRINAIIREAEGIIASHGFVLPPFAGWSPEEFVAGRDRARAVIDARLGWDITDYGAGDYDRMGASPTCSAAGGCATPRSC